MTLPIIKHGRFHCGENCVIGENVTVDVDEQVRIGDRCVIGDNTYFGGRSVTIGDDFYGYSHWGKRLEIGLGRRGEERAILEVGDRCTFHDNKIDLAYGVKICNDVGLSPEVTLYTHYYWQNPFQGYPMKYGGIFIGDGVIVGYRSTILPSTHIHPNTVVGSHSLVTGRIGDEEVPEIYGGVPAIYMRLVVPLTEKERLELLTHLVAGYCKRNQYRKLPPAIGKWSDGVIEFAGSLFFPQENRMEGEENELTDDFREWLFKRGVRIYTKRPFRKWGAR